MEVKGRVSEEKLERFFEDLRRSKHRTVTLGLLRFDPDRGSADEKSALAEVSAAAGLSALRCLFSHFTTCTPYFPPAAAAAAQTACNLHSGNYLPG